MQGGTMDGHAAPGSGSARRFDAWARLALRVIWLFVLPLIVAGLIVRYCVPTSEALVADWATPAVRFAKQRSLAIAVAVFLVTSWIARYWLFALPGGRHLAGLPFRLAHRLPWAQLHEYASAAELARRLSDKRMHSRLEASLGVEEAERIDRLIELMRDAVEADEPQAVRVARASIDSAARPFLRIRQRIQTLWFAGAVLGAAALAIGLRSQVAASYAVVGSSMLPGLEPEDQIAVSRRAYGRGFAAASTTPRRGDVVVFAKVEGEGPDYLVKRVIGLPGDRIRMRDGTAVINGWEIPRCDAGTFFYRTPDGEVAGRLVVEFLEASVYLTVFTPLSPDFDGVYEVKPGEVFVLGDNRSNSLDSRSYNEGEGGGVPLGSIQGLAKRFLVGTHRNGETDFSRFMKPLQLGLHLEGVDTTPLELGIQRCLAGRPQSTSPPPPHDTRDGASLGGDPHAAR
jgi:signal peptidase I